MKNISQLGWLFSIYGKIKNVPNHQPVTIGNGITMGCFPSTNLRNLRTPPHVGAPRRPSPPPRHRHGDAGHPKWPKKRRVWISGWRENLHRKPWFWWLLLGKSSPETMVLPHESHEGHRLKMGFSGVNFLFNQCSVSNKMADLPVCIVYDSYMANWWDSSCLHGKILWDMGTSSNPRIESWTPGNQLRCFCIIYTVHYCSRCTSFCELDVA